MSTLKGLQRLIHASNHSADGTSGQTFRNDVSGAGDTVKMTDYLVTGLTYVSGAPSSPGSYTYPSPYTFTLVFTIARNSKAWYIEKLLDSAGTYVVQQCAALSSGGRTYSQTLTWDYQTNTNNTVTITINATVIGEPDSSYSPPVGGGNYSIDSNAAYTNSVIVSHGQSEWSIKFQVGFNEAGDLVPVNVYYYTGTWPGTLAPSGNAGRFYGDGETYASGYSDAFLNWALTPVDDGPFNPIVYGPSYDFRQAKSIPIDPAYKWYTDSSFTVPLLDGSGNQVVGSEVILGSTTAAQTLPASGYYYVKHDNGKTCGPLLWSDPRTPE